VNHLHPILWLPYWGGLLLLMATPVWADWPQILGPQRDGVAPEVLRLTSPPRAPQQIWKVPLGEGYAGPAVVGDRVLAFHREGEHERLTCVSLANGAQLWQTDFPATYRGGIDPDSGPRCVPVVAQQRVFLLGAAGDCHAVDLASGKPLWSRTLATDYDAPLGYFGAGSTPLVIDSTLLVNIGGRRGGIVGLDVATGATRFATGTEQASYASPVACKLAGEPPCALFVTRLNLVKIDPVTGAQTVLAPFGRTGPTVNAASPLVIDDKLFLTASYGVGAQLLRLADPARPEWSNDDTLSSQYVTPVRQGDWLFGIHGREDIPPAHLRCIDWRSGQVLWSRDDFGIAHLVRSGDHLLACTLEGELVILSATNRGYEELLRCPLTKSTVRALPAFTQQGFVLRTNQGKQGALLRFAWPQP
jgi:outer membrane protein assembly factor BamB